jgi:AmmeMemoRadiSam system protein A
MKPEHLSKEEQTILITIARQALEAAVNGNPLPKVDLTNLPEALQRDGASFVTLTGHGRLRGCIGALSAYQPLALDVQEHAVAAALQDHRFPTVSPSELPDIQIEVSYLTPSQSLDYDSPDDLINKLRPGMDGVILEDGRQRATFLPQVWEQLPDPDAFLSHLCSKMGAPADLWQTKHIQVAVYQVQKFQEKQE